MLFHVEQCELIGRNDIKYVILEVDRRTNVEVAGTEVFWPCRAELLLTRQRHPRPLEKLSTHKARIAPCHLIDLQCVVGQEVTDDKAAIAVLPNNGHELGTKAQDTAIVFEEFLEVSLRWLRFHGYAISFGVLVTAPPIVWRQTAHPTLMLRTLIAALRQWLWCKVLYTVLKWKRKGIRSITSNSLLALLYLLPVVVLRKLIATRKDNIASEYIQYGTNLQILICVE